MSSFFCFKTYNLCPFILLYCLQPFQLSFNRSLTHSPTFNHLNPVQSIWSLTLMKASREPAKTVKLCAKTRTNSLKDACLLDTPWVPVLRTFTFGESLLLKLKSLKKPSLKPIKVSERDRDGKMGNCYCVFVYCVFVYCIFVYCVLCIA